MFRLSWIVPAALALLLPVGGILFFCLWWQTGFSWEGDPAPWYCAVFYFGFNAMFLATPIAFVWAVVAFFRTILTGRKQR